MIEVNYNEYKETIAENMKLIVENNRLKEVEEEHRKLNGKLREEIERLNNIINELEKWLEQEYAIVKSNSIVEPNNPEWYIKWNERKNVLNKLQELKGSNSNENL